MSGRAATVNVIPGNYALSVGRSEMSAPRRWVWVALTDVARLESGHTPSREHLEYWDGDIAWVGIKDARAHHGGVISKTFQTVTQAGIDNSAARLLPASTVCLSRTASVGYVVVMGREMATSQDFVNWVCGPAIDPHFLKQLLIAENESLFRFGKGSTHTTIYYPEVKAFHVCLPPLNEQRRIVAKLEALQARSRLAGEALDAMPTLLEKLRQSVLAAAFRGDLTKDWRAKHKDVEPASKLLERIRAERRKKWEESELAKMNERGRAPKGGEWRAKYKEAEPVNVEKLPELPLGWCWASVDEVTWSHDGRRVPVKLSNRSARSGPYPYYGAFGIIDHVDEYIFDARLVLIAEDGKNLMERKRPISMVADGKYWVNNHAHVLEPLGALPHRYLSEFFNWVDLRARLTGIDQVKLTAGALATLPVPIAPRAERIDLARRLEGHLGRIAKLETMHASLLSSIADFDAASLASAFRGELVSQDPDDEAVEIMLARVREASAATMNGHAANKEKTKGRTGRRARDTPAEET